MAMPSVRPAGVVKNFNLAHFLKSTSPRWFIFGLHMYLDEEYPEKQMISWLIAPVMVERPHTENFTLGFAH